MADIWDNHEDIIATANYRTAILSRNEIIKRKGENNRCGPAF